MKIHLLAFGIAKDILGARSGEYEVAGASTIKNLKSRLQAEHAEFSKLTSLAFAVNENYVKDDHQLSEGDEVVIIPPVSGG